jgi:hypothetical protein
VRESGLRPPLESEQGTGTGVASDTDKSGGEQWLEISGVTEPERKDPGESRSRQFPYQFDYIPNPSTTIFHLAGKRNKPA